MTRAAIAEARAFESWHDYQAALKRAIAPLTSDIGARVAHAITQTQEKHHAH